MNLGHGQNILVEDYDENYEPTEKGKRGSGIAIANCTCCMLQRFETTAQC